jgi:hypothetical protein
LAPSLFEFFTFQLTYGLMIIDKENRDSIMKMSCHFYRLVLLIYYSEMELLGRFTILYWKPLLKLDRDQWMARLNSVLSFITG